MNSIEFSVFEHDIERNITLSLAKLLDKNGWNVVACHPPGGHTSFSILDGRRSRGGYMPDVVAVEKTTLEDVPIVVIAESKPRYDQSDKDIKKLKNLSRVHASWIGFRLQKQIPRRKWEKNWRKKLQKVIAVGALGSAHGRFDEDLIILEFKENSVVNMRIGDMAPAKDLFEVILKQAKSYKKIIY